MNTNVLNSVPISDSSNCGIFTVISLMVLGCLIGTISIWCYQRTLPTDEKATTNKKNDAMWELLKIFGIGLGAVALVPAFLQFASSALLEEVMMGKAVSRFVFLSFCVAAAVTGRRFITTVSEALLRQIKEAQETANEAKTVASQATEIATSAATPPTNKAVAKLETPPEPIRQAVIGYDWKALLLIRAFLNTEFTKSRTTTGLAFDSGLVVSEALKYLEQMEKNGDVQKFSGDSKKGSWWALTADGHKKFDSLKPQLDKLNMVNTDVQ